MYLVFILFCVFFCHSKGIVFSIIFRNGLTCCIISSVRCEGQGSCPNYPYFQNDEEYRNIHDVFGLKNISMFNATLHEQMTNATIDWHINNSSFLCLSFFFSCPTVRKKCVFFKYYFELNSLLLIYLFLIDYHIKNLSFLCSDLVFFTFIILPFFLCNSEKKICFFLELFLFFFWNSKIYCCFMCF